MRSCAAMEVVTHQQYAAAAFFLQQATISSYVYLFIGHAALLKSENMSAAFRALQLVSDGLQVMQSQVWRCAWLL